MPPSPFEAKAVMQELGLTERQAREVADGSFGLVVLTTTAHADWDWILPFPVLVTGDEHASDRSGAWGYFNNVGASGGPPAEILARAAHLLAESPGFRYSFTEAGFLRAFAQVAPGDFETFAANADRVHLAGGGITSPDSVLAHGEAFVRNYLAGRAWAAAALPGATIGQCYVPDDFGHDPELPVTLQAMGLDAVAFARLPGMQYAGQDPATAPDGSPLQATTLVDDGMIDFTWRGADGSAVHAHYLATYYYGSPGGYDLSSPDGMLQYLQQTVKGTSRSILQASPTRFVYIALGGDMLFPRTDLPGACAAWNGSGQAREISTYCATASFDDFVRLTASLASLPSLPTASQSFDTGPYYCGTHVTRPAIKVLHQRAVRGLLAAEALAAFAGASGRRLPSTAAAVEATSPAAALEAAWNLLVPSTHHDFITGTAHPQVYRGEELPLLHAAVARATWLRDSALADLAALVAPAATAAVAVFNPLGFERTVLAEAEPHLLGHPASVECDGKTVPVQRTAEGTCLFRVEVPSLGYARACACASTSPAPATGGVSVTSAPEGVTLANGLVTAVLDPATGALASFRDGRSPSLVAAGQLANAITVYADGGNEYCLGCELGEGAAFADLGGKESGAEVAVLEDGPLRGRIRVSSTYAAAGIDDLLVVREYALVAGEPLLRMTLTGAAPLATYEDEPVGTTVFVKFPFALEDGALDGLVRGTPTHWTAAMPQLVWTGMTLYASHHFAIPTAGGTPLAGLLHADVPGWGLDSTDPGVLYGGVLRNTTGDRFTDFVGYQFGGPWPCGVDPDVHTRSYALLAPSACGDAAAGTPLRAALAYATPPLVTGVSAISAPRDDYPGASLASTAAGPAIVIAAKVRTRDPDALIVRLYQPTNAPLTGVELNFEPRAVPFGTPASSFVAVPVTALEEPLDPPPACSVSGSVVTLDMPNAIATIAISAA